MKWIEAKVSFDHTEPEMAADLVAAVFFDLDLQGVVIEDPGLTASADLAEDAIPSPDATDDTAPDRFSWRGRLKTQSRTTSSPPTADTALTTAPRSL